MKTASVMTEQQEEQMVHLVRNAVLAAGLEMGDGDQWPVVKDTIHKMMKDWEDLKIQRRVDEELKIHLYEQLGKMERGLRQCSVEMQVQIEPKLKEWREICDAYFAGVAADAVIRDTDDAPLHIKRMKAILDTMEEDHGH